MLSLLDSGNGDDSPLHTHLDDGIDHSKLQLSRDHDVVTHFSPPNVFPHDVDDNTLFTPKHGALCVLRGLFYTKLDYG